MTSTHKPQLPSLHSSSATPNKYHLTLAQQKQSLNDEVSLSYSHTNKNTHKHLSYDSEMDNLGRFLSQQAVIPEENLEPRYECRIGDDLDLLNSKLEQLENCFLNMNTIKHDSDKENIRPGMMKKSNKSSRQNSKEVFVTKRNNLQNHKSSYQATKRVSRRGSFLVDHSEIKQSSKERQISELKREVSFCQKSLSQSRNKKEVLEKKIDDCNEKIKNYKILERKAKKLESDYYKLAKTLEKSQQVRLKQKSLISKYELEIRKLNKLVKFQK